MFYVFTVNSVIISKPLLMMEIIVLLYEPVTELSEKCTQNFFLLLLSQFIEYYFFQFIYVVSDKNLKKMAEQHVPKSKEMLFSFYGHQKNEILR